MKGICHDTAFIFFSNIHRGLYRLPYHLPVVRIFLHQQNYDAALPCQALFFV